MISDTLEITRLLTRKTDLGDTRVEVSRESPLADGEALLKLSRHHKQYHLRSLRRVNGLLELLSDGPG